MAMPIAVDRAMTGCFRNAGPGHKLDKIISRFRILHRNIDAAADRTFIQHDATGRSAAECPVSLINR
jgi:hypothetical protein